VVSGPRVAPVQQALTRPPVDCAYSAQELDPDEMTPMGFTARERLAPVLGRQTLPFEWTTALPAVTRLVFEAQQDGPARLMTSLVSGCHPRFEVDLDIRLTSADGALAEVFSATASTYSRDFLPLDRELDASAILRIRDRQPGLPDGRMSVPLLFSAYGIAGGVLVQPVGEGSLGDDRYIARWPHACDSNPSFPGHLEAFPIQNASTRPGADELVTRFRRTGNMVRVDGSAVATTYEPQGTPRRACFTSNGVAIDGLQVEVDLAVRPAVGPVLTIPVRLSDDFQNADQPSGKRIAAVGPCSDRYSVPPQEFAARCGDWGINMSGFQAGFFSFSSHLNETCAPVVVSFLGATCLSGGLETRFDGERTCRGESVAAVKGQAILFLDPPPP
jgi:hypothetical protein